MKTPLNVEGLTPRRLGLQHWAIFLIVLGVILVTEFVIMCILPWLFAWGMSMSLLSVVDALVLTSILSPLIWWLVVRPQQREIQLRTRFVADLFVAIEEERRQTAYDLHDGVGQTLTLLISGLRTHPATEKGVDLQKRDLDLRGFAERALTDIRRLSQRLRPSLLDDLGLVAAMEATIDEMRRHHDVQVEFEKSELPPGRLGAVVETNVFRIFQEALNNIMKHSRATRVTVRIHSSGNRLLLSLCDNGIGFDLAQLEEKLRHSGGHLGLRGMSERAAHLGGTFAIKSQPKEGTLLEISIPLRTPGP